MRFVLHPAPAFLVVAAFALSPPPAGAHRPLESHLDELAERIARSPADAELRLARGELHRLQGAWRAAAEDFDAVARLEPGHPSLAYYRGRLALERGDPVSAVELLTAFLDRPSEAPSALRSAAYAARARALLGLGRTREAVADFDRAIAAHPEAGPELYVARARALSEPPLDAAGPSEADLREALAGLERGLDALGPVVALERLAIEIARRRGGAGAARELRERRRALSAGRAASPRAARESPRTPAARVSAAARREGEGTAQTQLVRGPYLNRGTPDGLVIRWRTDLPAASRVLYGDAPGNLLFEVEVPALATEHAIALAGLAPDTFYFYAVADGDEILAGDDAEHFFRTAPAVGTARPIRVWAIGDSGTADDNSAAVRDAYLDVAAGAPTDVWLMLGDNAYTSGTDAQYQAAVFDTYPTLLRNTVLWPSIGNHDALSSDSTSQSGPYFDIFTLPAAAEAGGLPTGTEAYYSFDYGNVHFIALDSSDSDRELDGPMMQWLEADANASSQPWLIAYWHHPPYTKGSHDSDNPADSGGRMFDMRERALPILEAAGVDLVLTGHSHSYERSVLIDGHYGTSGTLTADMLLDAGGGDAGAGGAYFKADRGHQGAVYAVAGSSGQLRGGPLDHPVTFVALARLGSLVIDVDGPRLDARFVSGSAKVLDRFTLVKGARPAMAIDDVSLLEGDAGSTAATFTIELDSPVPVDAAIDYATVDGTASAGEDYLAAAGTLTIPAGQVAAEIAVEVFGDVDHEGDESFSVVLSNVRNAVLVDAEGSAIIVGDDGQPIFEDGFESGDASAWGRAERRSDRRFKKIDRR